MEKNGTLKMKKMSIEIYKRKWPDRVGFCLICRKEFIIDTVNPPKREHRFCKDCASAWRSRTPHQKQVLIAEHEAEIEMNWRGTTKQGEKNGNIHEI